MMNTPISPRDWELLSAYLDRQLSPAESAALEARLRTTPALYDAFESLRRTQVILRSLPYVRAPRSFALTPQMAGKRAAPSLFPVFGFASALACLLLIIVLVSDFFMPGTITTLPVAMAPTDTLIAPVVQDFQEQPLTAPFPEAADFPTPTPEEASLSMESIPAPEEPSAKRSDETAQTIFPTMSPAPTYGIGDVGAVYMSPESTTAFQEKQIATNTGTEAASVISATASATSEPSPTPTVTPTLEPVIHSTQAPVPTRGKSAEADSNLMVTAESQVIPDELLAPSSPGSPRDEIQKRPPFFIAEILLAIVALGAGIVAVYLRRKAP